MPAIKGGPVLGWEVSTIKLTVWRPDLDKIAQSCENCNISNPYSSQSTCASVMCILDGLDLVGLDQVLRLSDVK